MTNNTIFISYRRDDSAGHAGRLFDRLSANFADGQVFMDVAAIQPGDDFVKALTNAEQSAAVLIVVIGRAWLSPRLQDPEDFVRLEIASAIKGNARLFPVLVQGAKMPRPADLPADIAALANAQALTLDDANFQDGIEDLMAALQRLIAASASPGFVGVWEATVNYSWGATHRETFHFEVEDGEILGTASHAGSPAPIQDAKILADRISFFTKSRSTFDFTNMHEDKHIYSGKLVEGGINFRLQTESPVQTLLPVRFTATRRLG